MAKPSPGRNHPRLYLGTTERIAKQAPVLGLQPSVGRIYISEVYPGILAFYGSTDSRDRFGIVELDANYLDAANFLPSEWYLEQTAPKKARSEKEQAKRLEQFRKTLDKHAGKGKKSLQDIGVCVYDAPIPRKAISRITIYDPSSNPVITEALLSQQISLTEHKKALPRNRALTRWLAGDEVTAEEWLGKEMDNLTKDERQKVAEWLQNKSGLDIFFYEPSVRGG
jgi:hypothetical protein